ncbi:PadR family transcriptional regulator [Olsenella profusa]|uniref:Helix-turn-helix transcriptional regulator n=1 Tax=Olsenella profusa TaxID=138595 RepID=A0ABS2F278_9ACTN|nr:PadR family transcriptional regulator [Olsenella profusa]MBM6775094.1 helix-turn-helix transcriptional regulator [Olsenella profusa]
MAGRDAESDLIRGNIDAIVLNTLTSGDSYGYEILKDVASASKGAYEMKEPSLYTSLKRLEAQGFVESYWGSESQGARRKYYHITEAGKGELKAATARWVRARTVIDRLLRQTGGSK